jgi:hypothetical protein
MKYLANKLAASALVLCVVLSSGGSYGCATGNNSAGKINYTKADFDKLRWLEGDWRGSGAGGQNPFFERYRSAGDAKIEVESFADSALSKVDGRSSIHLENGEIIYKNGAMVWAASRLDDSTVEFAPKEKATDPFAWHKESADVWTARLAGKDAQGKRTETVYRMERIKQ